jgi:hypothetical protein
MSQPGMGAADARAAVLGLQASLAGFYKAYI